MQNTLAKVKAKKKNGGFTLIELMVVLAIIAVLAAVMIPQYMQYLDKSKKSADAATASGILSAAKVAATDTTNVTENFTATWNGSTIVIASTGGDTETSAVATDIAKSLGTTSSTNTVSDVKAQAKVGSGDVWSATFDFSNGTVTEDATKAWWKSTT